MTTKIVARNVNDPRVRELVRATANPDLFAELRIPRSTTAGWPRGHFKPAFGTEAVSKTKIELHARVARFKRRIQVLLADLRLFLALVRVSGCRLTGHPCPAVKPKPFCPTALLCARRAALQACA